MQTVPTKFVGWMIVTVLSLWAFPSLADDIAVTDLPQVVTEAIQKRFPSAKLVSAEKENDDYQTYYEVKVQNGNQKQKVHVRPNGSIYKVEIDD
ncbi:hypothetical protein SD80_008815 [Scytonema tolypothrichoides VB-61278]|nr:hypothetical protein SD80_008815 [Scytonema tolypothrichoides VB-61278]